MESKEMTKKKKKNSRKNLQTIKNAKELHYFLLNRLNIA